MEKTACLKEQASLARALAGVDASLLAIASAAHGPPRLRLYAQLAALAAPLRPLDVDPKDHPSADDHAVDPSDAFMFTIDDDICTRCALCVDRCPTGVIILGKVGQPTAAGDYHTRTNSHGYGYGMRL